MNHDDEYKDMQNDGWKEAPAWVDAAKAIVGVVLVIAMALGIIWFNIEREIHIWSN